MTTETLEHNKEENKLTKTLEYYREKNKLIYNLGEGIIITIFKDKLNKKNEYMIEIMHVKDMLDEIITIIPPQKLISTKLNSISEGKIYEKISEYMVDNHIDMNIKPVLNNIISQIYNNLDKLENQNESKDFTLEDIDFTAEEKLIFPAYGFVENDKDAYVTESTYVTLKDGSKTFVTSMVKSGQGGQGEHAKIRINKFIFPDEGIKFKPLYSLPNQYEKWLMNPETLEYIIQNKNINIKELIKQTYNELKATLPEYVWLKNEEHYIFTALYPIMTYLFHTFDHIPILQVIGVPNTGKTRYCTWLRATCYHAPDASVIDPSRSDIFRTKEEIQPTMIVDENKNYEKLEVNTLLDIINGSYTKGNTVTRREPIEIDGRKMYQQYAFNLYSPFVMAGIFPDLRIDTRSRTIQVPMYKNSSKIYPVANRDKFKETQKTLYYIRLRGSGEIRQIYKKLKEDNNFLPELTDRNREIWIPFFILLNYIEEKEDFELLKTYVEDNEYAKTIQSAEQDFRFKMFQAFVNFLDKAEKDKKLIVSKSNDNEIHVLTKAIVTELSDLRYNITEQSLGQQLWMIGAGKEGKREKDTRTRTRIYKISEVKFLLKESYGLTFDDLRELRDSKNIFQNTVLTTSTLPTLPDTEV